MTAGSLTAKKIKHLREPLGRTARPAWECRWRIGLDEVATARNTRVMQKGNGPTERACRTLPLKDRGGSDKRANG